MGGDYYEGGGGGERLTEALTPQALYRGGTEWRASVRGPGKSKKKKTEFEVDYRRGTGLIGTDEGVGDRNTVVMSALRS